MSLLTTGHLIRVYTLCRSVLDFWLTPIFLTVAIKNKSGEKGVNLYKNLSNPNITGTIKFVPTDWTSVQDIWATRCGNVSGHLRTARTQISLCICAVWSGSLRSAIIGNYRIYEWRAKPQIILCAWAGWSEYAHVQRHFFPGHGPYGKCSEN